MDTSRVVYGYARVSSRGQAEDGVSLEAQEQRIRGYCVAKGWMLTEVLVDAGVTAKNTRRPKLQRLLREVREGRVETVVTLKVDRISRSTRDLLNLLEEFQDHKTSFVSVYENIDTSTSMGRFVITLLGSLAQLEREQVGERTAFALRKVRKDGMAYSRITPFGWKRIGDKLVTVEHEQEALRDAIQLRGEGASYQLIADRFTVEHHLKPHGGAKKWYPATVRQVLNSKLARDTLGVMEREGLLEVPRS